ncbi:MAG: hypothetical protein Q4F03_07385 [Eubacteriales bacterium]|nr:hypothetical protein [Eubacteriales bacterium]
MTSEKQEEYMERIAKALEGIEQELECINCSISRIDDTLFSCERDDGITVNVRGSIYTD